MDSLIPLLYITHDYNPQAGIDNATGILRDVVGRFNFAANALLEDNAGDKLVKAGLAKSINSYRYVCTANLNWR